MDVPKLEIHYPGPDDPESGTATTPYDIAALKAWAGQVTAFLEELSQLVDQTPEEVLARHIKEDHDADS